MGKRTESIVEIGIGEWGDDNEIVKGRERELGKRKSE